MIQIFIPYWDWEDYINGMWRKLPKEQELVFFQKAIEFTGNHVIYGKAMNEVIYAWPNTMINSLTNKNINRLAFLGHCACSYKFNCPEYITRLAWKELDNNQRYLANLQAQKNINEWVNNYERKNTRIHKNMGKQMLLPWYS